MIQILEFDILLSRLHLRYSRWKVSDMNLRSFELLRARMPQILAKKETHMDFIRTWQWFLVHKKDKQKRFNGWSYFLRHCFWSELKSLLLYCLYFFTFFYVLTGNSICCWQLFREAWEQPGHWSHRNTGKFYQVTWILTVIPRGLSCKPKSTCSHWFCIIASVLHRGISVVQPCRFQFVLQSGPALRTEYSTSVLISCFHFVGTIISFRYACLNFIHFCNGSMWCNKTVTQSTWEDEMCKVLLNPFTQPYELCCEAYILKQTCDVIGLFCWPESLFGAIREWLYFLGNVSGHDHKNICSEHLWP